MSKVMHFRRILELLTKGLAYWAYLLILLMTLLVTSDVTMRYVANKPIQGAYELVEFLLAGLVFSGIGYTQLIKGHIAVDILSSRLRGQAHHILDAVWGLVGIVFAGLFTWRTAVESIEVWNSRAVTPSLGIREAPVHFFVPLGFALLCLWLILDFVNTVQSFTKREVTQP